MGRLDRVHGDTTVSHDGHNWKSRWWTRAEEPGTTGEWGVWQDLGIC
ncbi:carbohydrate-binding protein [Streptomyces sp. HNM0663]|uniref:Carbohydrate-binding protein n=1 Tax=Streptomyces chengmaiensis TaxID=3040919 RepID=A0ABT6HWI6_9ACTN|nr:carbohydrate-binding protein [Streptomyces chengmaiensis]MDH2392770.1 carbohydrate-binding protein [Streptomyces chengmaiensis]